MCFVFHSILDNSQLFQALAKHQINFAKMHRSHGSINRETSGNLSPTGLIQNDSGSVSEAQSCRITLASKSLLANKTMYKHKWKQTLTYKCAHMLTAAYAQTHNCTQVLLTRLLATYWSSSYLIHTNTQTYKHS